ncbi:MAG: FkbM family methyltransferase [Rhabdaerophilum sp.]
MKISYAQNGEDILLWRIFGTERSGVYVDIGAQDPIVDSVTKVFYDQGWSGLNIEPVPVYARSLSEQRPRDITHCLAAGSEPGRLVFFDVKGTGLSTLDREAAQRYRDAGHEVEETEVEILPLDHILQKAGITAIDFLKIDTEGSELEVLKGFSLKRIRPKVVLIEVVVGGVLASLAPEIDRHMEQNGYEKAYFDGLNAYFVAQECGDLRRHFEVPVNVNDGFIPYHLHEARSAWVELEKALNHHIGIIKKQDAVNRKQQRQIEGHVRSIKKLEKTLEQTVHQLGTAQAEKAQLEAHMRHTEAQLHDVNHVQTLMLNSTSWRLTRPLRDMGVLAQKVRRRARRELSRTTGPMAAHVFGKKPETKNVPEHVAWMVSDQPSTKQD